MAVVDQLSTVCCSSIAAVPFSKVTASSFSLKGKAIYSLLYLLCFVWYISWNHPLFSCSVCVLVLFVFLDYQAIDPREKFFVLYVKTNWLKDIHVTGFVRAPLVVVT